MDSIGVVLLTYHQITMTMKRTLLFLFMLLGEFIFAQTSDLQKAISDFVNAPELQYASCGIAIYDIEQGKLIGSYAPDKSLIPASSLKVITTGTALALLGPDYRMKTSILQQGTLQANGQLNGDIFIQGSGDPTFGSPNFGDHQPLEEWAASVIQALQQKGVKKITGGVIADDSYFVGTINSPSWSWNDLGNYYASGAWSINIHENYYELLLQQNPVIDKAPSIVGTDPTIPNLTFVNELKSAGWNTGDNAYIFGGPFQDERFVRGTIPVGNGLFRVKGSIPNPPLFAAQYLNEALIKAGLMSPSNPEPSTTTTQMSFSEGIPVLHQTTSPPLEEIIFRANQKSVNLYCESLIKILGKTQSGEGSLEAGIEVIEDYWKSRGLDLAGIHIEDGSGLSPRNLVTSRWMVELLSIIHQDSRLWPFFEASLPIAGRSGTLKSFLNNTEVTGKLIAKSGTMSKIRTYVGYLTSPSGKTYAFATLTNHFDEKSSVIKRKLETLVLSIYRALP